MANDSSSCLYRHFYPFQPSLLNASYRYCYLQWDQRLYFPSEGSDSIIAFNQTLESQFHCFQPITVLRNWNHSFPVSTRPGIAPLSTNLTFVYQTPGYAGISFWSPLVWSGHCNEAIHCPPSSTTPQGSCRMVSHPSTTQARNRLTSEI